MSNASAPRSKKVNNNLPLLLLLLILLLLGTTPYFLWLLQPAYNLPGRIVDKTVPDHTYREHNALIWSLNHYKVRASEAQATWQKAEHYIGFYPAPEEVFSPETPGKGVLLTAEDLVGQQWAYVTDTYGVYRQDVENAKAYEQRQKNEDLPLKNSDVQNPLQSPDYSAHIYGGAKASEADALEGFAAKGGHLIGEFNLFASPTEGGVRERLESLFGVKWSGWTGRFFIMLENAEEVPVWARENYQRQYGKPWTFTGEGWLFVHEDGRILVLEEEQVVDGKLQPRDVPDQALKISLTQPEHPLLKGVYDQVPYTYWFDILTPQAGAQVLAEYVLTTHPEGAARLKAQGLPERFPFMVLSSAEPLRIYLAGDASDRDQENALYQLKGRMQWERFGRFKESKDSQEAFFWEFYLPWIGNVIEHVATRPCTEC
jgi:hypothetical protein